ncbi:MAG: hypothetical protein ACRCXK_08960 [Wohlfahrtiimonas sp.]
MKQSDNIEQTINDTELNSVVDEKDSSSNQTTEEESAPCCGCCGG